MKLRFTPNEWLAHSLFSCRERLVLEKDPPVGTPKVSELLAWAEESILLVERIGILRCKSSKIYKDRMARCETYCREFWHLLPVLREAEGI